MFVCRAALATPVIYCVCIKYFCVYIYIELYIYLYIHIVNGTRALNHFDCICCLKVTVCLWALIPYVEFVSWGGA